MSDVLGLTRLTHSVSFNGLGEYYGGLPSMLCSLSVGGIDFMRIMSTTVQAPDIVVRHTGNHFQQFRVLPKKVLTYISAVSRLKGLVLAVNTLHHSLLQQSLGISR